MCMYVYIGEGNLHTYVQVVSSDAMIITIYRDMKSHDYRDMQNFVI